MTTKRLRLAIASALLVGSGVSAAGYYYWQHGAKSETNPGFASAVAVAEVSDSFALDHLSPADVGNAGESDTLATIEVSASREDILQLLYSFADGSQVQVEGMAPAQAAAVIDAPQPLFMAPADPVEAEQRLAEASQRAVRAEDPRTRANALSELAALGDAGVLSTMYEALFDPDARVRRAAVEAVQRIALNRGDDSGEAFRWMSSAAQVEDAGVAALARAGANELAMNRGEEPPFP